MQARWEEIGLVALLGVAGLAVLWGLLLVYERALCWVRLNNGEGQEDAMLRKNTGENLPAVIPQRDSQAAQTRAYQTAPTTLDLAEQLGRGQGGGIVDGMAAVLAARHEAALEERMLDQVERRLANRRRLAEGVGRTVGVEDGAKQALHSSQINDIRREREMQAEFDGPPPPQIAIAPPPAPIVTPVQVWPPTAPPGPAMASPAPVWPPPASTPPVVRPPDPNDGELRCLADDACLLIAQSSDPAQAWVAYKYHLTHGSGYASNVRQELEELVQARLAVIGVSC